MSLGPAALQRTAHDIGKEAGHTVSVFPPTCLQAGVNLPARASAAGRSPTYLAGR